MKITERVINHLFYRMHQLYGYRWDLKHDDIDDAKKQWRLRLKSFSAENVGKALKRVSDLFPKDPPDLDHFTRLVSEVKRGRPGHLSNHYHQSEVINKADPSAGKKQLSIMREIGAINK